LNAASHLQWSACVEPSEDTEWGVHCCGGIVGVGQYDPAGHQSHTPVTVLRSVPTGHSHSCMDVAPGAAVDDPRGHGTPATLLRACEIRISRERIASTQKQKAEVTGGGSKSCVDTARTRRLRQPQRNLPRSGRPSLLCCARPTSAAVRIAVRARRRGSTFRVHTPGTCCAAVISRRPRRTLPIRPQRPAVRVRGCAVAATQRSCPSCCRLPRPSMPIGATRQADRRVARTRFRLQACAPPPRALRPSAAAVPPMCSAPDCGL